MRQLEQKRRGFALIAVLGVLTVLVLYVFAVEGAVNHTNHMDAGDRARIQHSEELAAIAAMLQPVAQARTIKLSSEADRMNFTANVVLRPLVAGDDVWRSLPGMRPRPGDAVAEIHWMGGAAAGKSDRILINLQSRRRGLVRLDQTSAVTTSTSSTVERQPS
ncbi:hypothetical protein LLG95_11320 [bacterium]|nr:hypothetical protein [bacterium]